MPGRDRGVRRKKQVPKRQRMDLQDVPVAENTGDGLSDARNSEDDESQSTSPYSDIGSRKNTTSVADGDDDSDSDDTDDDIDDDDDDDDDRDDDADDDDDCDVDTDDGDDSDNDKEDAKEKNVKETPKKGRPYRRSLDKDLKDASKTPSGRMARSRTKFTTDSPKKSSQSHQEHTSSSKEPVTAIFIETDEESDDDRIKPVSFAKKSTKMDSDSDSDATVSSLEPPSSTGKRKGSDDDDDDYKDDEKDKSSKKKRIKTTVTSSQETKRSVDTTEKKRVGTKNTDDAEESSSSSGIYSSSSSSSGSDTDSSDNSSSDTHSYLSRHDNNDDQWVEEGPVEDSNYIKQLRAIQKDDDGTLYILKHYILWFALKAGGENVDDEIYQETVNAKTKLDGRLEVVMNICQSQAWGLNFRSDVMTYPKFVVEIKREDLRGGDMRYLGNCQVCNRESHPWSVIVRLDGEAYNKETFEMIAEEEGEDSVELPPVKYYMGCFCHPRSKLYHKLYHFGYYLYHRCKEMLEELVDDEESIDTVAKDRSLFNEMYTKLKKWMNEAERDYTEDGERANNRWTRKYKQKF